MEYSHGPAEPVLATPQHMTPLPILVSRTETASIASSTETLNVSTESSPSPLGVGPGLTDSPLATIPLRQFVPWDPAVDEVSWTLAAPGAMLGVVLGTLAGAGWTQAIARGWLPAIGPVLNTGPSGCLAASMLVGALLGLILGALVGLGYPTESEA